MKLKQLKSIDEMIIALQEQHLQANLNKQDTNRKQVDMICLKVNPPLLTISERRSGNIPEIEGLIIPKIKCYYNLQIDSHFQLKTSLYPPLPPYSYTLYDLIERPGSYHRLPNFRTTADQKVTERLLNIEASCGSKQKFLIELQAMHSRGPVAQYSLPILQAQVQAEPHLPEDESIPDRPLPLYCFERYNCHECRSNCRFLVDQIQSMGKKAVEEELSVHGHPKSLRINRARQRNLAESRHELKSHYERFH